MKILRNNQVKIQPASSEAYKEIVKTMDAKGTEIEYYTYKPKQERNFRVILKHMHPSTDTEDIKEALANLGHVANNIWNMKQMSSKNSLDMFTVDLKPNLNNKEIYKINSLLYCRIKFEPPRPKRTIPQCSNCMTYGHTKSYCRRNPRCIKCAGNHSSSDCSRKERSEDVKCVLCDGNHPANYRGCSVYKELQKQKYPPLRINPKPRTQTFNRTEIEDQPLRMKPTLTYNPTEIDQQPQKHTQNTNYADVVRSRPTGAKPKTVSVKLQTPSQPNQTPLPTFVPPAQKASETHPTHKQNIQIVNQQNQESRENNSDFKELMDMFRQMMLQMTTMTNLLMNFMSELRSNSTHGHNQDFIQGGGKQPTLPHRGYTRGNR